MKSALSQILVRLTLAAYLAASGLGTGLHTLADREHHDHHQFGLADPSVSGEPHSDGLIEAAVLDALVGHSHDSEHACPVCQFHRLGQLHVVVDCPLPGVAVVEMPRFVPEQPAVPVDLPPYSPRGPPEPAVSLA